MGRGQRHTEEEENFGYSRALDDEDDLVRSQARTTSVWLRDPAPLRNQSIAASTLLNSVTAGSEGSAGAPQ